MDDKKIQIVIIDDHPLIREGIKTILSRNDSYEIVGEADCGHDCLKVVKKLEPDLVLLDLSLPDVGGPNLIPEILKLNCETSILVISMHSKIEYITKAFQMGAMGYLVKESAAETLLCAIEIILKGQLYIDTSVSQKMVKMLAELSEKGAVVQSGLMKIS